MNKIDIAMLKYMTKIVYDESRPFIMNEFLNFTVDGKKYELKYGTIRNKFSTFLKENKIELYTRSHLSFYTLAGVTFGNDKLAMTSDPTYLSNNKYSNDLYLLKKQIQKHPMYKILQYLEFGNRSIHDIHLKFEAKGLWSFLSKIEKYKRVTDRQNKSIYLDYYEINGANVQIIVQKTDTVTVMIGCSNNPVMLIPDSIMTLGEVLAVVNEKIVAVLTNHSNKEYNQLEIRIPNKDEWKIVLWHLGRDSVSQYSGKQFECSWNVAKNLFIRVYSKELKLKTTIVRMEIQENPDMVLKQLFTQFIKKEDKTRLIEVLP